MRPLISILVALMVCSIAPADPPAAGAPSVAAARPVFVFVHDNPPNQVFVFRLESNGMLVPVPGSPFDAQNPGTGCGGNCQTIAYSRGQRMIFAGGPTGISAFRVANEGTLALVPGSPFGGSEFLGVAAVDIGATTFVYGADAGSDLVRGFGVQADGSLIELATSPFAMTQSLGLAAVRDLVFAANMSQMSISAWKVQADGNLTAAPGSPFALPGVGVRNVFVAGSGSFLYVPDADLGRILAFRVDPATAAIAPVPGSPFGVALTGMYAGMAVGKKPVLFALDGVPGGANDIQALRRKKTGALLPLGGLQSSGLNIMIAGTLDPRGKFLIGVYNGPDNVRSYRVNASSGQLRAVDTETAVVNNISGVVVARL